MNTLENVGGVVRLPRFFGCNRTLKNVKEVEFDPYNAEHMECAKALLYRKNMDSRVISPEVVGAKVSRNNTGLKFKLKAGFNTVPEMMSALILQKVFHELETQ